MNEILKNIWNHLTEKELTKSSFEDWVANVSADEKIQSNIHGYLSKNNLTSSDFETWKTKTGLKKKDDSEAISTEEPVVSATPTQEEPGSLDFSQEQTLDNKIVVEEQPQPKTFDEPPMAPPRKGVRKNPDGSESTHLMATETFDGKNWFSFPTLFQDPDGTWVDMSDKPWEEAYEEAKRRGEVIEFGADKEAAIKFGEGSWKMSLYDKIYKDFPIAVKQEIDEAKVLQSAGIDQAEFDAWRKRTAREEGFFYSPFRNDRSFPINGEDPAVFYGIREREQMKFIQSYKTKQNKRHSERYRAKTKNTFRP